jgi:hypothetical protein
MRRTLGIAAIACLSACQPGSDVYTLYRSSVADPQLRVHVATFDAAENAPYNRDNCNIAAGLFAGQPGVITRYWCEKGRFRS